MSLIETLGFRNESFVCHLLVIKIDNFVIITMILCNLTNKLI